MERRIDPDTPLDYVELQIFPSDNRYEACVSTSNIVEKAASGDLEQLLLHLPQVKDLSSKTSDSNFRILPPDDVKDAKWFTTATLIRFLNVAGSPDFISIGNEISQLEETRKFQLSLFAKAEVDMTSSFESKNELLRAVDSRLSGLKEQLADAINQATSTCSPKHIADLENFAHHFGAQDIRDSLQKLVEPTQFPSTTETTTFTCQSNPPVKYGVSPAKAAQIERQISTDSEENSYSSEEEEQQQSVERSRTVARSATPRRSASPMRRVQIGRTGPRRSATLTIKSLGYFPARDKTSTQKDAVSEDEDEDLDKTVKQNALRMSVQDKISLFENKQKDITVEPEKPKTLLTNKSVLRRWSSGMSESAAQPPAGSTEIEEEVKVKPSSPKKAVVDILDVEKETRELEMHPDSSMQQKEAELNHLFKKMMESKPVRRHSVTNDNNNNNNNNKSNPRGGFYDHYKQKREEKLRKEASGKKAEKESQFKEMEKFLDEKKAEMANTNTGEVSRKKGTVNKVKPQKNTTQLSNIRKETAKTSVVKKSTTTTTPKPSPLPVTRKSWPTSPSPRPTGTSPAKSQSQSQTPSGPASTGNSTRKPQSTSSVIRSSTKVEKPKPRSKTEMSTLKSTPTDANKNLKTIKEKKQPTVTKVAQKAVTKPKSRIQVDGKVAASLAAEPKPSFYNKVTKKSSVVPLETKPFLRKGTRIGPVVKSKVVVQPEEPLIQVDEKNQVVETTESQSQSQNQRESELVESVPELDSEKQAVESETTESQSQNHNRSESFDVSVNDGIKKIEMVDNKNNNDNNITNDEESTISISPTAWVEIEDDSNQDEIIACKESPVQVAGSSANDVVPAGVSSPRVRHSLFQMLLEETSSEADSCEWGNAQNPPAMVNQKDGPKGFKRLLKFARKTKADLNLTDGSSPSSIFRRG